MHNYLHRGNWTDCSVSTQVNTGMPLNTTYACQKPPSFWVKPQAH